MDVSVIELDNLEATARLGERLGARLRCGDLIALIGPLGAGKTTLVKSIAAGAGVADPRQVNSPTFVLVNEYAARAGGAPLRMFHIDAYRLRGAGDLEALGFDEMCAQGVVLIEWADRIEGLLLPPDRLTVRLEPLDAERRLATLESEGTAARFQAALREADE